MTDEIDRLSRRRRVILATYGVAFLAFQSLFFTRLDSPIADWRAIHYVTAGAYVLWAASLLYIFASGGLPFRGRSPQMRSALNDELTAANRRFGYQAGYWFIMGTMIVLYVLYQFGQVTLPETLRLLFAFGVAMPAVAFAGRERRQGA